MGTHGGCARRRALHQKDERLAWGTCNTGDRRIWLNLELMKKPALLPGIHLGAEMVHLIEASHNERFRELMDKIMPQWPLVGRAQSCAARSRRLRY